MKGDRGVMKLARHRNAAARIVIPEQATAREQFAAQELQKYIRQICGAELFITTEPGAPEFLIGGPGRNRHTGAYLTSEEFLRRCPGPEGLLIQSFGEDVIVLAGSEGDYERGTIYAVYEFLERFCGASLAAFSHPQVAAGEYVPQMPCLALGEICYVKPSCDLKYRGAIVQYASWAGEVDRGLNIPFLDWLCKNRYNDIMTWASCFEKMKTLGLVDEAERRGIRFTVGHHEASKLFLPAHGNEYFPEHYYETHPEYYRLSEDGTRYEDTAHYGQWIFCSRNQEMIDTLAAHIKIWLTKNPQVDTIFFPPNDGIAPQCVCPDCAPYSKVENYVYVLNAVAKQVREQFPKIRIVSCAYTDLFTCPEHVTLDPALCVNEATWHASGLRAVGKPDGSCLNGTFFEENLIKWHATGASVTYYDYDMGVYPARQRYLPMADEIRAIAIRMQKNGFDGAGTQIECFNLWNHLFNFYCFARTQYDSTLTMEDHLQRFCRIFGEGADAVAEVIRYAEQVMDGQETILTAGIWLMQHIDKERVYRLYDRALALAKSPAARNNIRLMRMAFRYSDLETAQPDRLGPDENYVPVWECNEPTGELNAMTEFDSFWKNDPGYGIDIPARSTCDTVFEKNKWYLFD